ncbi:MAG: phosphoribosylanthranilate isomerase [Cellvibrionaceae bacterium]
MKLDIVNMNSESKSHTRVKICGLTSVEHVQQAISIGADAIGMVFYDKSSRNINAERAIDLVRAAGPFVTTVGLFVNPQVDFVRRVLREVPLQLLQFHGDETSDFCEQFERPYIKALRVKKIFDATEDKSPTKNQIEIREAKQDIVEESKKFVSAQGILLDAYSHKGRGGTGESFNWGCVPESLPNSHLILAGGLSEKNIADAVRQTRPYAVDVSSGVESSPGHKDFEKMAGFVRAVREADDQWMT